MALSPVSSFKELYYALEGAVGAGADQSKLLDITGLSVSTSGGGVEVEMKCGAQTYTVSCANTGAAILSKLEAQIAAH